jgi:mRNA interferase MazF
LKRGDVYRVRKPSGGDPKRYRFFVIVSRQVLIDSKFSTVICAPVYTSSHGISTQVPIGAEEGLKHDSSIHCDELISLPKSRLTDFISSLRTGKLKLLDRALATALDLTADRVTED